MEPDAGQAEEQMFRNTNPLAIATFTTPSIKKFSGRITEDVEQWLAMFEDYSEVVGWNEKIMMRALRFYLSGAAEKWWSNNKGIFYKWEDITKSFKQEFTSEELDWNYYNQLENLTQGKNQGIFEFALEFENLYERIHTKENPKHKMLQFISKINYKISNAIRKEKPKDYKDALKLAKNYEIQFEMPKTNKISENYKNNMKNYYQENTK